MNPPQLAATVALTSFLIGCAGGPGQDAARDTFLQSQSRAATLAQENGELARALAFWRSILTLEPDNRRAGEAARTLQTQITRETKDALRQGRTAFQQGNTRDGERWMLRALALTPGEPEALATLRTSVSNASHAAQKGKSATETPTLATKQADDAAVDVLLYRLQLLFAKGDFPGVVNGAAGQTDEHSEEVLQLLRAAHLKLAERAAASDEPERQLQHLDSALASASTPNDPLLRERAELAHRLSDRFYKRGLALLKTDLPAALSALEQSVALDPGNVAARDKLDQAETLQKNLEKIRSN